MEWPAGARRGFVCYDAQCRFCCRWAARARDLLASREMELLPLQTPWVLRALGQLPGADLREFWVLMADGGRYGGAEALIFLAGQFWWAMPLGWLAHVPGARRLLKWAYGWVARHRHCQMDGQAGCETGLGTRAEGTPGQGRGG